jgi:hypothetical protein
MKLEDSRTHGTFKFATDGIDWVDPGQEAIHAIDVAFPAEALKAGKLKRLPASRSATSRPLTGKRSSVSRCRSRHER